MTEWEKEIIDKLCEECSEMREDLDCNSVIHKNIDVCRKLDFNIDLIKSEIRKAVEEMKIEIENHFDCFPHGCDIEILKSRNITE